MSFITGSSDVAFPSSIEIPDIGDQVTAESIYDVAQPLADRTAWLKHDSESAFGMAGTQYAVFSLTSSSAPYAPFTGSQVLGVLPTNMEHVSGGFIPLLDGVYKASLDVSVDTVTGPEQIVYLGFLVDGAAVGGLGIYQHSAHFNVTSSSRRCGSAHTICPVSSGSLIQPFIAGGSNFNAFAYVRFSVERIGTSH